MRSSTNSRWAHKQKKEEDAAAADRAMQEETNKEYEANKEVEKQAIENNNSTVETRDKNKALETGDEAATAVEDIKTQTLQPETENAEEFQINAKANVLPENVEKELDSSDEGQEAKNAVESNDPTALQNIVTPEGDPILKGTYNEDGVYLPHTYTIEDSRLVKNPGMAACLTIVSKAITALGAIAGIPIPMIDFMKFGATPEEDLEKLNENEQNYAKILNAGKAEANETIRTREANQESNLSDIDAYKNLADEDVQKTAQVNAATSGQNAQLDVQKQAQEFDKWKTEYSGELQKTMQEIQNKFQLDLTDKLYKQQVQAIVDKITYMKESGFSNDDIAKAIQSMEGVTTLQRGMGYAKDTVGMVTDIANSAGNIIHGKASSIRANAAATNANTNMFRENRLGYSWE